MQNKNNRDINIGDIMYQWASDLFPICRSITGAGVRQTLNYIKKLLPELKIYEIPSGTKAFDWVVPNEWNIRGAFIEDESGKRIIDFQNHNLHVMGYSEPVDKWLTLEELNKHLYSIPEQPNAIPYVTSYYERNWGFCVQHNTRKTLKSGKYHVVIDSSLKPGVLNYGELIINGREKSEILLSTYICHPSMANNELSGPVVTCALAKWVQNLIDQRFTYRILFLPERIGSLVYLSENLDTLKTNTIAGFQITCVGDEHAYSFLPSRDGNTLSDQAALHVLKHMVPDFKMYSFFDGGSDERQYCSPGVDLPVVSIMRSMYGEYPEYHTSLDNLDFITPNGLKGSYQVLTCTLESIERNKIPRSITLCEPQLGKRGLYPNTSTKTSSEDSLHLRNFFALADGTKSLLNIADLLGIPFWEVASIYQSLRQAKVII